MESVNVKVVCVVLETRVVLIPRIIAHGNDGRNDPGLVKERFHGVLEVVLIFNYTDIVLYNKLGTLGVIGQFLGLFE